VTSPTPVGLLRLRADAVDVLSRWRAPDPAQEALRLAFLDHCSRYDGAVWRHGPPAHLTASAVVLDASGKRVLLAYHGKARCWLQLGGHLEPSDLGIVHGAAREAREESGIADLAIDPVPVHLDRHALNATFGRCREHLDVRFVATAHDDAIARVSTESEAVRWFPVSELPDTIGDVGPLVAAALARRGT
jgi:8-oxo-dGTP pyrophosphatase MutT (NUDIX family)